MKALINPRHEHFVRCMAGGASPPDALVSAGYSKTGASSAANRLLKNVLVRTRLEQLQQEIKEVSAQRTVVTRDWVLDGLKTVAVRCMAAEPVRDAKGNETGQYTFNASGANRALELLGKQLGMFHDAIDHTLTWNGDPSQLSEAQLAKMITVLEQIAAGPVQPGLPAPVTVDVTGESIPSV